MQHDDNKPIPLNIDQSPSNSIETGRTPQHSQTSNIQQGFDYTTNCRGDFYEKLMPYVTELIDGLDFEIQREMSKLQIEDNQEMEKDKDKQKDKDREKFKDKEKVRQKSFNS
ncbi:MAG: hypothetical protein EZS28_001287 [Streblomastix strix]|uniref:Uncharacterized protein n=1 Tax=Streblomastix strix TaxID=222440 RepID=A0A5J4X9C5_9EUKA|nr:MAG: hypothetical protein EZS28_001287 [Streblomastix strix]